MVYSGCRPVGLLGFTYNDPWQLWAELRYEYNLFEIDRTHIAAKEKLPTGTVKIEVRLETRRRTGRPYGRHAEGEWSGGSTRTRAGSDLGSPVSLDYFDQAPFAFNGKIVTTRIAYLKK